MHAYRRRLTTSSLSQSMEQCLASNRLLHVSLMLMRSDYERKLRQSTGRA